MCACPCRNEKQDFLLKNALNVAQRRTKIPYPRVVDQSNGYTKDYFRSGLGQNFVYSPTFTQTPPYICDIASQLLVEDQMLKCMLLRDGVVCGDSGHNNMNRMGLLVAQNSGSPLVRQSKFYKEKYRAKFSPPGLCYNMPRDPYPAFKPPKCKEFR